MLLQRKERFAKLENLFLLLSLILCPLYLTWVPIFQVPDEVNHYVRAYGIVHGYLLSPEGGNMPIPDNLIPYEWYTYTPYILFHHFKMNINSQDSIIHNNVNMALYSPISYIFQVLGIGIADLFCNNTYILVLAGSVTNIAGCTILIYYAIKFVSYGKGVIAFISLLPMALQERASLSVDAITYAALVIMLSFCLYMRHKRLRMNRGKMTSVGVMEALVFSVGWLAIAKNYLGNTRAGGDAVEKLKFIIHSPGRYLYILDKMFWQNEEGLIGEMLGSKLGSLNIAINIMLILFIMMLFFKVYFAEKMKREQPDYLEESVMVLLSIGIVLLIATSLYVQWTDIAASTYSIEGLQGRYFLPVLPLICCAFLSAKREKIDMNKGDGSAILGLYVINLLVLMDVASFSSYIR